MKVQKIYINSDRLWFKRSRVNLPLPIPLRYHGSLRPDPSRQVQPSGHPRQRLPKAATNAQAGRPVCGGEGSAHRPSGAVPPQASSGALKAPGGPDEKRAPPPRTRPRIVAPIGQPRLPPGDGPAGSSPLCARGRSHVVASRRRPGIVVDEAAKTAARAAARPRMAADWPGMPSLDCSARVMKVAQRTWQPDTEHHGKAADLVFQSDPLADQLLASD